MREKLIELVKKQHAGQLRKYTNEPYYNHVLAVAEHAERLGIKYGFEIGLCHDLIEDTDISEVNLFYHLRGFCHYSQLACEFIVESVNDLTDVFTSEAYPYLNRKIRKQCEALRLHSIPGNSQIIKCCDLIDNTKSIIEFDEGFARTYIPEKREIIKGFTKISGQIKADVWECLLQAELKLNPQLITL